MNIRELTRLTNVGLLAAVGLGAGHLFMPARASTTLLARALFAAAIAGTGALVGWRERRARELDGDEDLGAQPVWIAAGAALALGLSWLAYVLAHG